jgi:hypothetical protein
LKDQWGRFEMLVLSIEIKINQTFKVSPTGGDFERANRLWVNMGILKKVSPTGGACLPDRQDLEGAEAYA